MTEHAIVDDSDTLSIWWESNFVYGSNWCILVCKKLLQHLPNFL